MNLIKSEEDYDQINNDGHVVDQRIGDRSFRRIF